jgi:hypothetical protein
MRTFIPLAAVLFLSLSLAFGQYGDISDLKVANPADKEHVKSVPPPKNAVVLFDGKSLDGWVQRGDGKSPVKWTIEDGGMQVKGGDIHSKEKFDGKFKLHVEFRVPHEPKNKGQGKGNSGVYVQGRYEVQILDSYGLKPGMGDCGAVYGIAIPKANACKVPTIWQSYDIEFTAPTMKEGKKVEGRMTVIHNGVRIHDNIALTKDNTTSGMGGDIYKPGPIMLQDHGHPVQFRNIWVVREE